MIDKLSKVGASRVKLSHIAQFRSIYVFKTCKF